MTATQRYQGPDLALAHQIAVAEYAKLNLMRHPREAETLSTAHRMPSLEAVRLQAEQALEEIEAALEDWFASIASNRHH